MQLKQATARNLMIFMTDALDRLSGKAGLTLTITASKDGGAFAAITPTVTDRGNGWYALALTPDHTDTLGDFALHVTGTGADPSDLVRQVVADGEGSYTANDLLRFAAAKAAGKTTIVKNGTLDHTVTFRDVSDTRDITVAHVLNHDRVEITLAP